MDIRSFFSGPAPKGSPIKQKGIDSRVEKENSCAADADQSTSGAMEKTLKSNDCSASFMKDSDYAGNGPNIPEDVRDVVSWASGSPIPYAALVATFESIGSVSGRLEKERILENLFRAVVLTSPDELEAVVYLAANEVAPVYEGMELGIGDSLLIKAICEATGRKRDAVEESYEREGDLGDVAMMSRAQQKTLSFAAKPKPLTCRQVLDQFRLITRTKGEKAQGRKVDVIRGLMVRCSSQSSEAKFIIRALQGKLRIGTAQQTVLVSLAHAALKTQLPQWTVPKIKEAIVADVADLNGFSDSDTFCDSKVISDEAASCGDQSDYKHLLQNVKRKPTHEAKVLFKALKKAFTNDSTSSKQRTGSILMEEWMCDALLQAEVAVKRAYSECPNYTRIVTSLLNHPLYKIHELCCLTVGVPVAPMLAKPSKKITEVIQRLSGLEFTMEYKYDGERAQVHLLNDGKSTVKIFSRNSEDNSEKYPDLKEVIRQSKEEGVTSCILDCEVVAYDRTNKCLLPFQVLSTRKRKVENGEEDSQKVKVILQAFDLLYINDKSLLREPLTTRRKIMRSAFKHQDGLLHFAMGIDHMENGDTGPIEAFLQEACTTGLCEGLMVKTLHGDSSNYEPSKRSMNWLKLKKDYIDGMGIADSVDLVVLGGYLGRGKRTNVYGAYLMACYDQESDEYQSVCKVGTGFKDEDLSRLTTLLRDNCILQNQQSKPSNYIVSDSLTPDHWFEAKFVWELQAADLSRSSVHSGGLGRLDENNNLKKLNKSSSKSSDDRGIGLRFPRYIRERCDKKATDATSSEQIVEMFLNQSLSNVQETPVDLSKMEDDDWI